MPVSQNGTRVLYDLIEYAPLLDSSNMDMRDWVRIAADIGARYNDYDAFVQQELGFRKVTGYPPFARLLRVLAEARHEDEAKRLLLAAVTPLRPLADVEVLGPAPAVIHKVKDHWRWHMLVKAFTKAAFEAAMAAVGTVEDLGTRTCRVTLDVDPSSLM